LIKQLLEKACKVVEPIMKKRKWHVSLVTEFLPPNPGLLGLNQDRNIIKIRCRRSDKSIYTYETILGTLLHELAHMECSAHDAAFHKLLEQLYLEAETVENVGILSITSAGCGYKLSTHNHNPDRSQLRRVTAQAAEDRRRISELMSAPQKLGGNRNDAADRRTILSNAALTRVNAVHTNDNGTR
jgi:hypothetical protein